MPVAYNPDAIFEVRTWDIEFRRTPTRTLMARIYQPQADDMNAGSFPVVLDLHGGAWNNKDRLANVPMDEALAASGMLVVAIDMTLAPEAPYPASLQDAHYGLRWLKANAARWGGDPASVGVLGSSSGGHLAQLIGMRPYDARYGAIPLAGHPGLDASVRYVATRSPISDPVARFENAQRRQREEMMQRTRTFFRPWETIDEANPQAILDRAERVELPPMLVMQGGLDDNVLPEIQQKFADSYRAAGGECMLEIFPGCGHIWVADPGPETDRAHALLKSFIARALARG
jgi:acetyl esterase/lipase